jgi:micrococcal nuclease
LKRRNSLLVTGGVVVALLAVPTVWSQLDRQTSSDVSGLANGGPIGPMETGFRVNRVVDGDTVEVIRNGVRSRVRLLGIDAPESVKPNAPVECFGPEASAFATAELLNRNVILEFDPSQPRTDQFDRTLAYVWVDGAHFNVRAIAGGYAERYRASRGLAWEKELVQAEQAARSGQRGLWGACP